MENKFILFQFGLLLIAPVYYSAPTTSIEKVELGRQWKAKAERAKLIAIALNETMNISDDIHREGPKLIEAVLKDPKVLEVKNEAMEKNLEEIRIVFKQLNGINKIWNSQEGEDIYESVENILDKYDEEKQENLSPEAVIINKSLKDNGFTDLKNNSLKHLDTLDKKLDTEIQQYVAELTENEKKTSENLIDWVEKLKAEIKTGII